MKEENKNDQISTLLSDLFENAKVNGGLNYLYTLLRISGISSEADPLVEQYELRRFHVAQTVPEYRFVKQLLELLYNLNSCCAKNFYHPFPFVDTKLSIILSTLVKHINEAGNSRLSEAVSGAYSNLLKNIDDQENPSVATLEYFYKFSDELLKIYFSKRLGFKNDYPYHKLAGFEVLEFLVNEKFGLYGFRMHFSNGTNACFERTENSVKAINIILGAPINFMAGDLGKLKHEWRVGEKRLYEIGIPGRYNKWGEWKPIIYPGNVDSFEKECRDLSEDDDEVEGTLFYMMCTGHRVVEFVVRTPIRLPNSGSMLGNKMHLVMCDSRSENEIKDNLVLYDGHYELDSVDPASIRRAIASINVGLNRMAFAYDSFVEWSVKYRAKIRHGVASPTPSDEDLEIFNSLLVDFPVTEDAIILDIAIDWFHRGELTKRTNPFLAFLCYYIALESVAAAVADGEANLGLNYIQEDKGRRKERITQELKGKQEEFLKDPIELVRNSYFDYIVGLTEKTRKVTQLVFGNEHPYVDALFKKSGDKEALSSLRGNLAHGAVTLLDKDHKKMIEDRLEEMTEISSEFIKRIIFYPKSIDEIPKWSRRHSMSMVTADPRNTKVASRDNIFGNVDWKIKSEWLD